MHDARSLGVRAEIRLEKGRWAVYLCATFWAPHLDPPLDNQIHRIADYPTRRAAEIAASWMERGADRHLPSLEP
jgi:hypothetical protein